MSHDNICNDVKDCPGNEDEKGCDGCQLPTEFDPRLTIIDLVKWQLISANTQRDIKHGDILVFNCEPDGTTYYEPRWRLFACYNGSWVVNLKQGEAWSFDNNGYFPECRPVKCPVNCCKYNNYCVRDFKCSCPPRRNCPPCEQPVCSGGCAHGGRCIAPELCQCPDGYQGKNCQHAVCNGSCLNGGSCISPDTCICPNGYKGERCEHDGCPLPSNLKQGLTLWDVKAHQFITSANKYIIPHDGGLMFNCSSYGNKYYEPSGRIFACYQGTWVGRHGDEPWNFNNNETFPECRPVECPDNYCKFGGHCIQDFKCQCPDNTTGEHCEHPVCSKGCENGGYCTAPDTCACKEGFSGRSCEFAGCAKPEGNLVNLKEQFYGDGETIMITERNCENGYLPSSGDITLNCKNGQWSDKVSCVTANTYLMRIVTSSQWLAGTDGNVMIKLTGSKGHTGRIQLQGPFGANEVKAFNKTLIDVGTIHNIELGVYRVQWLDGWKPKHVVIQDINREHFYYFPHDESEVDDKLTTLQRKSCPSTFNKTAAYVVKNSFPHERRYINFDRRTSSDFECLLKCIERECLIAEYTKRQSFCVSIFQKDVKITSFDRNSTFVYKRNCV